MGRPLLARTQPAVKMYNQGFSIEDCAAKFGISRQSMWDTLRRRGVKFRHAVPKEFVMFDGRKYSLAKDGYYRLTVVRRHRKMLHQAVWEFANGTIPVGFDIHHRHENDKATTDPTRLECLTPSDHTRIYSSRKHMVEFRGESKYITQWAAKIGISAQALTWRLGKWPIERALTEGRND